MMRSNNVIPEGWAVVSLREILHGIEAGKSFECEQRQATPDEWGVIKVSAMTWGRFDEDENKAVPSSKDIEPRHEIHTGDLLLSRSNTVELVGASVLVHACRPKLLLSDKSMRLRACDEINRAWLQRILSSPGIRSQLSSVATGSSNSMRNVSQDKVLALHFGMPPKNEQQRIVEKVDELFSDLDVGVAALKRAKANLKRYRAAVLKAAVEGKLTEEWRAKHPAKEPASTLLARILKERRQKWETDQLAKFAAAGKEPPKNWRDKYVEPSTLDTSGLPELPEAWCWLSMEQLTVRSEYGTSVKCDYGGGGPPVLRIPNIARGELDLADMKFAKQPLPLGNDDRLQLGDMLMCRTNGSISLIGKSAVVRSELSPPHTYASYLLRFRFGLLASLPSWVHVFVTSFQGRRFIESNAASSAGQHNISLSLIHTMPIPLPPMPEQQKIIEDVSERLSQIDAAETQIEHCLRRATRLRQSILKQAFEGKLVPQDPNDEPASVLLERLRASRSATEGNGKAATTARTRGRREKSKQVVELPEKQTK